MRSSPRESRKVIKTDVRNETLQMVSKSMIFGAVLDTQINHFWSRFGPPNQSFLEPFWTPKSTNFEIVLDMFSTHVLRIYRAAD